MINFNEILDTDLNKYWVYVEKDGNIKVQKKDNKIIRALKDVFSKLCCCFDPYRSIRLKNVVHSIAVQIDKDSSNAEQWEKVLNKIQAIGAAKNKKYKACVESTQEKISKIIQNRSSSPKEEQIIEDIEEPEVALPKPAPQRKSVKTSYSTKQISTFASAGNLKCFDVLEGLRKQGNISQEVIEQTEDKMMTALINQKLVLQYLEDEKCYVPITPLQYKQEKAQKITSSDTDKGPYVMFNVFINKSWTKPCRNGKGYIVTLPKWTLKTDMKIVKAQQLNIIGAQGLNLHEKARSFYLSGKDLHLNTDGNFVMICKMFKSELLKDFDNKVAVTIPGTTTSRCMNNTYLQGWILTFQTSLF